MKFISLNMIDGHEFNEDTGEQIERTKPVLVNAERIRCFYPRRDNKPGTRITFSDGGGFAVAEIVQQVQEAIAMPLMLTASNGN